MYTKEAHPLRYSRVTCSVALRQPPTISLLCRVVAWRVEESSDFSESAVKAFGGGSVSRGDCRLLQQFLQA